MRKQRQKAIADRSYCHGSSEIDAMRFMMMPPKWKIFFKPKHSPQAGRIESNFQSRICLLYILAFKLKEKSHDNFAFRMCNTSAHCSKISNTVACQCGSLIAKSTCI